MATTYKQRVLAAMPPDLRAAYNAGTLDDDDLAQFGTAAGIDAPPDFSTVTGGSRSTESDQEPERDPNSFKSQVGELVALDRALGESSRAGAEGIGAGLYGQLGYALEDSQFEPVQKVSKWAIDKAGRQLDSADSRRKEVDSIVNQDIQAGLGRELAEAGTDLVGSPTSALSVFGGPIASLGIADVYNQEYVKARRAGLSDAEAKRQASLQAVPEAIGFIPAGKFIDKVTGGRASKFLGDELSGVAQKYGKKIGLTAAGEALEEGATSVLQIEANRLLSQNAESEEAKAYAASQIPKTTADYFDQVTRAMKAGGVAGAGLGTFGARMEVVAEAGKLAAGLDQGFKDTDRFRPDTEKNKLELATVQEQMETLYGEQGYDAQRKADEEEAGFRTMERERLAQQVRAAGGRGGPNASPMAAAMAGAQVAPVTPEQIAAERVARGDTTRSPVAAPQEAPVLAPTETAEAAEASTEAPRGLEFSEADLRSQFTKPVGQTSAPIPTPKRGLASLTEGEPTGLTAAGFVDQLKTKINKGDRNANVIAKLVGDQKLVIVDSADQIPNAPANAQGWYDGERTYLVAGAVDPDNVVGQALYVAAHEVKHGGDESGMLGAFMGDEANQKLVDKARKAKESNRVVKAAWDTAKKATADNPENFLREFPAYLINASQAERGSKGVAAGLLSDVVSAVRVVAKAAIGSADVNFKDVQYLADKMLTRAALQKSDLASKDPAAASKLAMIVSGGTTEATAIDEGRTWLSADGKRKYELDDSKSILTLPGDIAVGKTYKAKDLIIHDELFSEIPETEDVDVTFIDDPQAEAAASYTYDRADKNDRGTITMNLAFIGPKANSFNSPEHRYFIHELQHAVQKKAGSTNGANPEMFLSPRGRQLRRQLGDAESNLEYARSIAMPPRELDDVVGQVEELRADYDDEFDAAVVKYKQVLGEQEAYSTMRRLGKSQPERMADTRDAGLNLEQINAANAGTILSERGKKLDRNEAARVPTTGTGTAAAVKGPGGAWRGGTAAHWADLLDIGDSGTKMFQKYLNRYAGQDTDPLKDFTLPDGERWEDIMDRIVRVSTARDLGVTDAPSGSEVWWLSDSYTDPRNQGIDRVVRYLEHVGDYLKTVPENKLAQYDLVRAVKETAAWDEANAKKAEKARAKADANLVVFKGYPDGFRWVQLTKPGQFAQESDVMGHSVRGYEPTPGVVSNPYAGPSGYAGEEKHPDWVPESGQQGHPEYGVGGWDAIKSGAAQVFSLRDPKGLSHVTIEVEQGEEGYRIVRQIKGKSNKKPLPIYTPYVQDFVTSQKFELVRDSGNADLIDTFDTYGEARNIESDVLFELKTVFGNRRYYTEAELEQAEDTVWRALRKPATTRPPGTGLAMMPTDFNELSKTLGGKKSRFTLSNILGQFSSFGVLKRELGNIKELADGEAAMIAYVAEGDYSRVGYGIRRMAKDLSKKTGVPYKKALAATNAKVTKALETIGNYENPNSRAAALAAYIQANPELKFLQDAVNHINEQTDEIIAARMRDPKPLTDEELVKYNALVKNKYKYFTTTYAAFQGKEGRARNQDLYDRYLLAKEQMRKGLSISPKYAKAFDTYSRGLKFVMDNDVLVFDPEHLATLPVERISYLYGLHVTDPENLRAQIRAAKPKLNSSQRAKLWREMAELQIIEAGKSLDLDQMTKEGEGIVNGMLGLNDATNPVITYYRNFKEDTGILEFKTAVPDEIRELYGEITDVPTRLAITLAKQGELAARMRMLATIREQGVGKWIADRQQKNQPGFEQFTEQLSGKEWGPLDGMYTTPAIAAAINENLDMYTSLSVALSQGHATVDKAVELAGGRVMKFARGAASVQKYTSIVLSPFATVANAVGSPLVLIQNGVYDVVGVTSNVHRARKAALRLISNQIVPGGLGKLGPSDSDADLELFLKYGLLDSAIGQELRSTPTKFLKKLITDSEGVTKLEEFANNWHTAERAARSAKGALTEAFALSDAWVKPAIFLARADFIRKLDAAEGTGKTDDQIYQEAADMTKNTTITFQRAAPIIKALERGGVTQFATYFQGVFRSIGYAYAQGAKDLFAATQAKTPQGQALLAIEGTKRIAGALTSTAGIAFITAALANAYNDDDDDDLIDGSRKLLFPEGRFGNGVYLGKDKAGNHQFIRLSRFDPLGPANDLLRIAISNETPEAKQKAIFHSIKELWIVPRATVDLGKLAVTFFGEEPQKNKATKLERLFPATTLAFKHAVAGAAEAARDGRGKDTAEAMVQFIDDFLPGALNAFDEDNRTPIDDTTAQAKIVAMAMVAFGGRLDSANAGLAAAGAGKELVKLQKDARDDINETLRVKGETAAFDRYLDLREQEYDKLFRLKDVYDGMIQTGVSPRQALEALKDAGVTAEDSARIRQGRIETTSSNLLSEKSIIQSGKFQDKDLSPEEKKAAEKNRAEVIKRLKIMNKKGDN